MIWNPPRCPQANGVVERSQGTGKRWAEPATCRDAAELQGRLDEQDEIQRRDYPSIGGRSRWEAFPGLAHSGRAYRPEAEAASWDLGRVLGYLAGCVAVRRGDGGGTISLYNRNRYVSRALAGREVYVTLDSVEVEWVYSDQAGICYRRQKAEELTAERITGLDVYHRRERPRAGRPKGLARLPAQPHVA
jgi:hypothetical protein